MASAQSVMQFVRLLAFPIAVAALLVSGGSAAARAQGGGGWIPIPPEVKRPNFVVIVLDDLGTDKLGFYGQAVAWGEAHAVTPNLDAIAAGGALFWNAYASPLCSPSRAMLLTGRHAFKTGMFNLSDLPTDKYDLPDGEVLLPEMLEYIDDRYTAGAFGKWHLTDGVDVPDLDCEHPIRNGFDVFAGNLHNHGNHFSWERTVAQVGGGCFQATSPTWSATQARIDASNWIQAQDEPFFAYVAFFPPHFPVQVPPLDHVTPGLVPAGLNPGDYINSACPGPCTQNPCVETGLQQLRNVYRATIEALDYEIGQLLSQLPVNTYVFVIGDNGTELRAVQTADTGYSVAGAPYPPHQSKRYMMQLGVRVPLLVKGPGVVPGIRRSPVSAVDIWKTIAHLAGGGAPAGGDHGISFRPLLMALETWPPPQGSRRRAYVELAGSNGDTWNGGQWSPNVPSTLQRALISYDGFKYLRYGSSLAAPSCIVMQACGFIPPDNQPVVEEVHQLYTNDSGNFIGCDENETGTSLTCGSLPTCQSPATTVMRNVMIGMTGP